MRIFDRLAKVVVLERESQRLWDHASSNLAYGNLSAEQRDHLVRQTYQATRLHAEALQILRDLITDLNAVLGTSFTLDD